LGAIGQGNDLSDNKSVETVVTGAFESKDDETRAAAAYALGNVAVGNLARFLPSLLALIGSKPNYQYLLFCALKEAIAAQSKTREAMVTFPLPFSFVLQLLCLILDR
jgi:cullin-associated NEDD8-dissociated protein 1